MQQCFIISLPRAGSTLLQRLLATHPQIRTVGEPWLALPFVYALRADRVRAEYEHRLLSRAFQGFVSALPGKETDYYREAGAMLRNLQQALPGPPVAYFLDKTPRYYLILDELPLMFPGAKYIVLHRNPLAVAASIVNTWKKARFRFGSNEMDVYDGTHHISKFIRQSAETMLEIRYEDLVVSPEQTLKRVTEFLELPPLAATTLPQQDAVTQSRLGDKTGVANYDRISTASLESWKQAYASPIRRAWAGRYLDFLGGENLQRMGYVARDLLEEIASEPISWRTTLQDVWDFNWRLALLGTGRPVTFVWGGLTQRGRARYRWKLSRAK